MNEFSEMMNDRISIYDEAGKLVAENELALVNYKRSVELNDKNENAKKVIERLLSN